MTAQPPVSILKHIASNTGVLTDQGECPKQFPVRENTGTLDILYKHKEFCMLKLLIT